jgi:hypothetical protein
MGRYDRVYGHSSTTFQLLSSLPLFILFVIIILILQAALPTMVIASNSRGPHQLPLTFILANKNVSSTARKLQAKEMKPINSHFKCGETVPVLLWVLSPVFPLHPATLCPLSPSMTPSSLRRSPSRLEGKVKNWKELG